MPAARIALATCAEMPDLYEDDRLVLSALREQGHDVEPAVWDAAVDWGRFDLVVLRSTWDYVGRRDVFVDWARSLAHVVNPADVVEWNTDKVYLEELAQRGVPIVPTRWIRAGDDLGDVEHAEFVIKPSVSAGARDTIRHAESGATAREHVARIVESGRTAMIQPYIASVDSDGETALIYFAGEFSHAIRKGPILAPSAGAAEGLFAPEAITARRPSPDELQAGERVLDALPWPRDAVAYARVDLVRAEDGSPLLLELEVTEPSLFLAHGDGAAGRFAEALGRFVAR